jgi:hypothetical protein
LDELANKYGIRNVKNIRDENPQLFDCRDKTEKLVKCEMLLRHIIWEKGDFTGMNGGDQEKRNECWKKVYNKFIEVFGKEP